MESNRGIPASGPEILWTSVVAAAGTLFLATGALVGIPTSKAITGADCILRGGVPYRDFWTMYAPGQFWAVAALFSVCGRELLVQGIATAIIYGTAAAVFFRILRRLEVGTLISLALAAVFIGLLWRPGLELSSYPPALLLLLLALHGTLRYLREGGPGRLVRAGALLGLAAFFKHDVAAYVAAGTAMALTAAWLAAGARRPAVWLAPVGAISRLAGGALFAFLPFAVWTGLTAGPEAWSDLFVFPLTDFAAVRAEGFPGVVPDPGPLYRALTGDHLSPRRILAGLNVLSVWAYAMTAQVTFLAGAAIVILRARAMDPRQWAAAVLCLVLIVPFWVVAHVQQNTHLFSMAMLSMLLFGMAWRATRSRLLVRAMLLAVALVTVPILAGPPAAGMYRRVASLRDGVSLKWPGSRGLRVNRKEAEYYVPIVSFLRTHTRPDEPIYVGVARHDAIVISNQRFYFLADRPGCCPHYELHPGVTDRESVQREIIEAIETQRVRCVVLWRFGWPEEVLNVIRDVNQAATADGGSTLIDRYLAETFDSLAEYGEYVLMWRKGEQRPNGW